MRRNVTWTTSNRQKTRLLTQPVVNASLSPRGRCREHLQDSLSRGSRVPTPEALSHRHRTAEDVIRTWARNPGRAVIFDFNGTLSDDEPILLEIFTELFEQRLGWSMTAEHYRQHLLGHSDREIIQTVVAEQAAGDPTVTNELLALRRERYQEVVKERSPITEAATALVRRLCAASVPMAIVTGAQREDVLAVLSSCEAGQLIDILVTEEDVERGKPDPEGFLKGAALLNRKPEDVLVFEDSVPGAVGAARAGMACLAVGGPDSPSELAAAASATVDHIGVDLLAGVTL